MTFSLRTLFRAPEKRERFVVIEILHTALRIGFFKVSFQKNTIHVFRIITLDIAGMKFADVLLRVKTLIRRVPFFRNSKVIVGLDPLRATTIHALTELAREDAKSPITEADLQNYIAQGMWKVFDHERGSAADKMNTGDLDIVLSDVRIKHIKLNNHRVISPVGFNAKTVSFECVQTFTPRMVADALVGVIPIERLMLIGESGSMALDILVQTGTQTPFLLVQMFDEVTDVFFSDGVSQTYVGSVTWGKRTLIKLFSKHYAVSSAVAEYIISLCYIRQASPYVLKKMEDVIFEAFQKLGDFLRPIISKGKARAVYVMPFFDFSVYQGDTPVLQGGSTGHVFHEPESGLPEFIFGPRFRKSLGGRVKVYPIPHDVALNRLGFTITSDDPLPSRSIFSNLIALIDFSFLSQDDTINKVARRHARWLTTL